MCLQRFFDKTLLTWVIALGMSMGILDAYTDFILVRQKQMCFQYVMSNRRIERGFICIYIFNEGEINFGDKCIPTQSFLVLSSYKWCLMKLFFKISLELVSKLGQQRVCQESTLKPLKEPRTETISILYLAQQY